jgi:hypothetical protein
MILAIKKSFPFEENSPKQNRLAIFEDRWKEVFILKKIIESGGSSFSIPRETACPLPYYKNWSRHLKQPNWTPILA